MLFQGCSLNELVSNSIKLEDACHACMEERKKRPLQGSTRGAPPMYRLVYTPPSGQPRGPPLPQQWSRHPSQWVTPRPPVHTQPATPPRAPQPATVAFPFFNYGRARHFAREWPHPNQGYSARAASPHGSQQKAMIRAPSLRVGRANFTTVEEIPPGEEVLLVHSSCMSTQSFTTRNMHLFLSFFMFLGADVHT
jgi:hypothetical protein